MLNGVYKHIILYQQTRAQLLNAHRHKPTMHVQHIDIPRLTNQS